MAAQSPATIRRKAYATAKKTREQAEQLLREAESTREEATQLRQQAEQCLAAAQSEAATNKKIQEELLAIETRRRQAFSICCSLSDFVAGNQSSGYWLVNLGVGTCQARVCRAAIVKYGSSTTCIEFGALMEAFLLDLAKKAPANTKIEISCTEI